MRYTLRVLISPPKSLRLLLNIPILSSHLIYIPYGLIDGVLINFGCYLVNTYVFVFGVWSKSGFSRLSCLVTGGAVK